MKNFSLLLLLFVPFFTAQQGFSQDLPINKKTGKVSFENIVEVDGMSKIDLYLLANEWFAKKSHPENSAIQMRIHPTLQDGEEGMIIGEGNITAYGHFRNVESGVWKFTVSFTAKEGRFRYVISDIYHETSVTSTIKGAGGYIKNEKPECGKWLVTKKQWEKMKARAYTQFQDISKDLEKSITNSEDDNW